MKMENMIRRILLETREASAAGMKDFHVSMDNLLIHEDGNGKATASLSIPYKCKTFEILGSFRDWRFFLASYFVTIKRHLRPAVTDLPLEIILLLKQYLVSPSLDLRVEIQFPSNYPFEEPTFVLHNEKHYALPKNITVFFADKKHYFNQFSPAFSLCRSYLPLIKEQCEREMDEEYETEGNYSNSCRPHTIRLHFPNNPKPVVHWKKVRLCGNPNNHYKTVMQAIPKEFRGWNRHNILFKNESLSSHPSDWMRSSCGSDFDVYLT
jgi:hypothetical protein